MAGLLITGTDTGVGKTLVACALLRAARAAGLDPGAMKPAESGCARGEGGELVPADALLLQECSGGRDPLELVCPYRFEAPLAPGIAAQRLGTELSLERIAACFALLAARHRDGVIVEGAGGLLVPLDPGFSTVADLALRLSLPVLVVARAGLGTVNHTALTVEALAIRGLECRGVILSAGSGPGDPSEEDNSRAIERLADVRVLASIPRLPGLAPAERIAAAARLLREALAAGGKMDLPSLLA